jgi:hypothetical protein
LLIKTIKREKLKKRREGVERWLHVSPPPLSPPLLVEVEGVAPPPSTLAKGDFVGGATHPLFSAFFFFWCFFIIYLQAYMT